MSQPPRTSEVFVEIEREGRPPLRTTWEAYMLAAVDEIPKARWFVVDDTGDRIYLRGGFVEFAASLAGYRRARIATATDPAVQL